MVRGFILVILGIGFAAGAGITVLGLLAPLFPSFEITNHFRPFTAGGFLVLLAAVWLFKARSFFLPVLCFTVVNIALFLLPLSFKASEASPTLTGARTFKLISFNMWVGDRPLDDVAAFLSKEDADVVVLQEFNSAHAKRLLPGLKELYPHQLSCADDRSCLMALLSKTPWTDADFIRHSRSNPALVWARFGEGSAAYRIATLHNAWPFQASAQANHTDWLIEWRKSITEPLLMQRRRFQSDTVLLEALQVRLEDRPEALRHVPSHMARPPICAGLSDRQYLFHRRLPADRGTHRPRASIRPPAPDRAHRLPVAVEPNIDPPGPSFRVLFPGPSRHSNHWRCVMRNHRDYEALPSF